MSTQAAAQPPSPPATVTPYRMTVRQFLKAVKAGVFPPDVRLELLGGIPVQKMTRNPPHNSTVYKLACGLRDQLPGGWLLYEEKPIVAGRTWRPEPDLAVIRGPIGLYERNDPKVADVSLVIEVSDTTYGDDRGLRWRRYAAARLMSYWIVNLNDRRVEAYSDPTGRGGSARYNILSTFKEGDSIPLVIDGVEIGRIAVNDVLPADVE
jgi:hypothetical protein